ncbi:hypothetical protein LUZ60_010092 [Juncus effusus]|nr:hypothetical protein LUZ60_010092 [Juncus effusus]
MAGDLVDQCIQAAAGSAESVETWRRQRRTIQRLPSHLADLLLRRLISRKLVFPSLLEVFQHNVEHIDLSGDTSVGAEWLAYIGAFRELLSLNLSNCRNVTDSSIWPLSGMATLKELNFSRCPKLTDAGIKHLISIQTLEKLYLDQTRVTSDGVKLLTSLSNLSVLDLGGTLVNDEALLSLQVLSKLEYLDLWGGEISNTGASILQNFPRLSFLSLAWTDVTILPFCPSIHTLDMSNCSITSLFSGPHSSEKEKVPLSKLILSGASLQNISEALSHVDSNLVTFLDLSGSPLNNFDFLENFINLEHLGLGETGIGDEMLEIVAKIGNNLKYLDLKKTRVTTNGISSLAGTVPKLGFLCLAGTAIDDSALAYVSLMPSLETLHLSHTNIKGFIFNGEKSVKELSISALNSLINLESLNLEETQLKDEAIYPLLACKKLKYLYLKSEYLSDASFQILASLPNLKFLGFRGAVLTDSAFLSFSPQETLEKLDLRECWLLSENVIKMFCEKYDKVELVHELNVDRVHSKIASNQKQVKQGRKKREELQKASFADERIQYTRTEMVELKPETALNSSAIDISVLPQELRRME